LGFLFWLHGTTGLLEAASPCGTSPVITEAVWQNEGPLGVVLDECYVHTFIMGGAPRRVIVRYTTDIADSTHRIPDVDTSPADGFNDWAVKIATWAEEAWRTFTGYGFSSSALGTGSDGVKEVYIDVFDIWLGGGAVTAGHSWSIRGKSFPAMNRLWRRS